MFAHRQPKVYQMKKIWIIILPAALLFSCRKEHANSHPAPIYNGIPVTVSLNQSQPGRALPAAFEGLSFETKTTEQYPVNGKSFVVDVPAGSVAVVTVK